MIYDLDDSEFEAYVIRRGRSCVVQFWAEWSGPCRTMHPRIAEFAKCYEATLDVIRINVDRKTKIPEQFGVRGIPTFIAFKQGKAISTKVGSIPLSKLIGWCDDTFPPPPASPEPPLETVAITAVNGSLKLVSLLRDGSYRFLDDSSRLHELICSITLENTAFAKATQEFETMINDKALKEQTFQEFFLEYPDFILNDDYRRAHSHIVLERETGNLIPDFMLEPINQEHLCDILDIKTPSAKLLNLKKNRVRFSSAVFEGVAQLREYQAFFEDSAARTKVEEKYKLVAYRPRLFLIIGRRGQIDPITMKRVRQDLQGVEIQTFDELLLRAKARLGTSKVDSR